MQNASPAMCCMLAWHVCSQPGPLVLCARLKPFTHSSQTHPWRVLSADSGDIVTEFVAAKGVQTFRVGANASGTAMAPGPLGANADADAFEGFDGIGRGEEAYAPAEVGCGARNAVSLHIGWLRAFVLMKSPGCVLRAQVM